MLKDFIAQLATEMHLKEIPQAEQDGRYLLKFSSRIRISLRENADSGITFHTLIAPLPSKDIEEFFLTLMKANLLGKETGGAALGLDKEGKMVSFSRFLPSSVAYKEFHDSLEDFVNYAESWQKETYQFMSEK